MKLDKNVRLVHSVLICGIISWRGNLLLTFGLTPPPPKTIHCYLRE